MLSKGPLGPSKQDGQMMLPEVRRASCDMVIAETKLKLDKKGPCRIPSTPFYQYSCPSIEETLVKHLST